METIVITGAGGRIGTLLRTHWQGKYRLLGIDIKPYKAVTDEHRFQGGIEFEAMLHQVFKAAGPGATVVHLAGKTWDDAGWEAIERVNIHGMYTVLHCAHQYQTKKVIFAGSNHVTGGYNDEPASGLITPEMPPRPDGLYGASKILGEALCSYYSEYQNLPCICLRIGSVTDRDDPTEHDRLRATWLSHGDLCHLIDCCLRSNVQFGIYYGVSNNSRRFWDIANAQRDLGYNPQDNAETWYIQKGD